MPSCHGLDLFHEIVNRRELFGDDILDPVFELQCGFVVRRWAERVEQVADLGSKGGVSIMIARFIGHS
jgi:hypothetical protein